MNKAAAAQRAGTMVETSGLSVILVSFVLAWFPMTYAASCWLLVLGGVFTVLGRWIAASPPEAAAPLHGATCEQCEGSGTIPDVIYGAFPCPSCGGNTSD